MSDTPDKYPEVLGDIADQARAAMLADGIDPERAERLAFAICEQLRDHFGGQLVYIPKGLFFQTRQRYEQIWAKFNGTNHAELAREHNLTEKQVYKIVKLMRAESSRKNQGALFTDERSPR